MQCDYGGEVTFTAYEPDYRLRIAHGSTISVILTPREVRQLLKRIREVIAESEEPLKLEGTNRRIPASRRNRQSNTELEKSYKRVRQAVSLRVRELTVAPQLPPDLLGLLILQPVV